MTAPPRLLFVDDDAMIGRVFERLVTRLGYAVDIASGFRDAVRRTTLHEYDVIATALTMSGTGGIELVERLAPRAAATVFLLVTGSVELQSYHSKEAERRIAGVIGKPFDPAQIKQVLEGAFAMSARRRAGRTASEVGSRTLLVEDDLADARLLADALEALDGVKVEHVRRLSEAVRRLHEQRFDTIVTDSSLPDARGLDAVTRLRTSAADATLIVCSAQSDDALELQLLDLGAQDVLQKSALTHASVARVVRFARVRRSAERRLARLAFYDALTGLANRALFHERLGEALRARRDTRSCGVMFLDLNGFKAINDSYGHDAGDLVLREFASRMRSSVREGDLVARLGGDEFAVVVPSVDSQLLEGLAQRILDEACRPVRWGDVEIAVATSIGLATAPACGDSVQQLLQAADLAMYEAKRGAPGLAPVRMATRPPSTTPPSRRSLSLAL